MQHLMLILAILLLAGFAGKKYDVATDSSNTILMQMEKMQKSKINMTEEAKEGDDFFIYGAPALYDSFL